MNEYENKIELINYLNVLWKRKWFILIPTFLFTVSTAVISILLPSKPPKLQVDAIFEPSKLITRNRGQIQETPTVSGERMAEIINLAEYHSPVAKELSIETEDLPELKAENLKPSNRVRISTKEKDVEKAKLILQTFLKFIKRDLDNLADHERKWVVSQIKPKEIEKSIIEGEIKANKNKLDIIEQRKPEIEKEMTEVRKIIEELGKRKRLVLERKNKSEFESLAILLYSNEILQSTMNHNMLNELLDNKKIEEKIIKLEVRDKERLLDQIENELNDMNIRKEGITYTKITKEPTSSISPVSPKKLTNVLIAGILALLIFGMLAFFLEYIEKQKSKLKT